MEDPLWPALEELELTGEGWLQPSGAGLLLTAMWRGAPRLRRLAAHGVRISFEPPMLKACGWTLEELDLAALLAAWRGAPRLRALSVQGEADSLELGLSAAAGGCGWALEELKLSCCYSPTADGIRGFGGAPRFALRRLDLSHCRLNAAALREVAAAPWPLEELDLSSNDFFQPDVGPALAALSRHARLERLKLNDCGIDATAFAALASASWPALTHLTIGFHDAKICAQLAASVVSARFPELMLLMLKDADIDMTGARALASRTWPRLRELALGHRLVRAAPIAAGLAHGTPGAWPALTRLLLIGVDSYQYLTLDAVRRWAPALLDLRLRRWWPNA